MKKKITIIILTWNGLQYTKQCLASLQKTDLSNHQVIVVDNGSTDGTLQYLKNLNWIKLIVNKNNIGYTKGNNIGMKHADPKSDIILMNNDIVICSSDWLSKLQQVAYSNRNIGIVGCRLIDTNGHLGHGGTYMPTTTFCGQEIHDDIDVGQYTSVREVQGVVFACAYIKRQLINKIGYLDEKYFAYFEDTDYCLKAKKAGYKTFFAGNVNLLHFHNTSIKVNQVNLWDMYNLSREIFMNKWRSYLIHEYKEKVVWRGTLHLPIGYASAVKNQILSLDEVKVDVRFMNTDVYGATTPIGDYRIDTIMSKPINKNMPQVIFGQGDHFKYNFGKYKIGYTMLEVDGLPEEWIKQCNQMDEVWVPSSFNKNTFAGSGVKRPIYVMPLGVDPNYFHPGIKSFHIKDKYIFLSVFEWGERKAPEVLLKAYNKEFSKKDNVLLLLNVKNNDPSVNVKQQISDMNLTKNRAPIILMLNQSIPDCQLGTLYRSADCFVLPTRGEGWGAPILEAMACGLPTISTDWGGHTAFFNKRNGYPIKTKLISAVAKCPYYKGFKWADPDEEHLRFLMRYVYENATKARIKGLKASEEVNSKWTWINSALKIKHRLSERFHP